VQAFFREIVALPKFSMDLLLGELLLVENLDYGREYSWDMVNSWNMAVENSKW
jgi:hypothetical protein